VPWTRYVAIGDSSTEGLDDPDGDGGYRGWADRLAQHLADAQGEIEYANLAVRGRCAGEVRAEQLDRALALEPDLATVVAGMNDLLRPGFDAWRVAAEVEAMHRALIGAGATVVTVTMPDLSRVAPIARPLRTRVVRLNAALRAAAGRSGAVLVDLAANPVASDPRLWSEDRLHGNPLGHERTAAALAAALGLPDGDGWDTPLPPTTRLGRRETAAAEVAWWREHLGPWVLRRALGRSSGDGRGPKRPEPVPVRRRALP
jgi:lysophospholipase L1-like esterase